MHLILRVLSIGSICGSCAFLPRDAAALTYTEVDSFAAPTSATMMIYSPTMDALVLKNAGSAIVAIDIESRGSTTRLANSLFTDMSLSPSGRYVFGADYGGENIGYGTPSGTSYVHRLDLTNMTWDLRTAYIAGNVQAVSDTQVILKSIDQWVTFTNNAWGSGNALVLLNTPAPSYYASVYAGDFRYDVRTGRLLHGNAGLSSQEIQAFRIVNNEFVKNEGSGTYGSAQGYGGTVVLATDGSAFYYGALQVDPLDVTHNVRVFPERIFAASGSVAFGNGNYYDAHTGMLLGALPFSTTIYAMNPSGDDFWAFDPASTTVHHFVPSSNVALASAGAVASASSTYSAGYPASAINNSERAGLNPGNGGYWNDATPNALPDWIQIIFSGAKTVDHVVVYSLQDNYLNPVEPNDTQTFTLYGIAGFTVQGWDGATWVTLATVSGNNLVKRSVTFAAYTTDRIRINITGTVDLWSRLTEVEAWGTAASGLPTTSTTLTSSGSPVTVGSSVTFTATVAGTNPTGSVSFAADGGAPFAGCSAVALTGSGNSRTATCNTSSLAVGIHSIVGNYSGDAGNAASISAPLSQVINAIAPTYQVSGAVTLNGTGLSGVNFATAGGGSCTVSDAAGRYACTVAQGWSGTVTPSLSGYSFTPSSRNYNNVAADLGAQDYAAAPRADTVWVDDAVPGGAILAGDGGDGWSWIASNPAPYSGSLAHQSVLAAGEHQHYFYNATATMAVAAGDTLFAYVYLDPASPPSEVMLQWNDGSWEHRAYWGANLIIGWGTDGTVSRRFMGTLPATGQWVRLSVPAAQVGLEGRTLNGMAYTVYGGGATWDYAGKTAGAIAPTYQVSGAVTLNGTGLSGVNFATAGGGSCTVSDAAGRYACTVAQGWSGTVTPSLSGYSFTPSSRNYNNVAADLGAQDYAAAPRADTVWVDDAVPGGAILAGDGGDGWSWIASNPAPYSGSLAHQSVLAAGEHQHYFYNATATMAVAAGDTLFAYVYLDPASPPSEVMLQWNDGSWEHRAYWGANLIIGWGTDGTVSRRFMGTLPATGQWVRLSVPAAQVGLEGRTLNGMAYTVYGGGATWDYAGKTAGAIAPTYTEVDFFAAPTSATMMIYSPTMDALVLKNAGSAIVAIDIESRGSTTRPANSLFTDMSLSPSGRYVFAADYGGENIGYGTPSGTSYVHRLDLTNMTWDLRTAYIAGNVQAVSDTQVILKSIDQWVTFTNNAWGSGNALVPLNTPTSPPNWGPGYYAAAYSGDFRYDLRTGRLLHASSGLSPQEIQAFRIVNNEFVDQEGSGVQGYGPNVVLATDGSAFYYGALQVDPLDVTHNVRVFPERIFAASGSVAFGNGNYYDAHTGMLLGALPFSTTIYAMNPSGDDFWAFDPASTTVHHFVPSSNVALASAGAVASASSTYSAGYPASAINNSERAGLNPGDCDASFIHGRADCSRYKKDVVDVTRTPTTGITIRLLRIG